MNHAPGPAGSSQLCSSGQGLASAPAEDAPLASPAPGTLETVSTPLAPDAVIGRLTRLAKQGRLAGFRVISAPRSADPPAFACTASGGIYDQEVIARITPESRGSRLTFELRLLKRMPAVAVAIVFLTLFPGLPLTDSMLRIYFSWYTIPTWWWYLPLTVLMIPVMWKQFRASVVEARRDAAAIIRKIERELRDA